MKKVFQAFGQQFKLVAGALYMNGVALATQVYADTLVARRTANKQSFPRTSASPVTLIPAVSVARFVMIVIDITTTFAAGDGAAPIFNIGETGTTNKFKSAMNTGSSGTQLIITGTLSANSDLLVTPTAATGTTSTGAINVTAFSQPASGS